jgi:hypothetical protein
MGGGGEMWERDAREGKGERRWEDGETGAMDNIRAIAIANGETGGEMDGTVVHSLHTYTHTRTHTHTHTHTYLGPGDSVVRKTFMWCLDKYCRTLYGSFDAAPNRCPDVLAYLSTDESGRLCAPGPQLFFPLSICPSINVSFSVSINVSISVRNRVSCRLFGGLQTE